jgi:hypothetical protein
MATVKRGFGRISRKHLEVVPDLLERANDSLRSAEVHMRSLRCDSAIWNLTVAARVMGRAYESFESAGRDSYRSEEFRKATQRLERLTREVADHCGGR